MTIQDEAVTDDQGPCLLYLFSGPKREGCMSEMLLSHGWQCENVDIEVDPKWDLLDDQVWRTLHRNIKAQAYHAVFMSPPFSIFPSESARMRDDGLKHLRDSSGPGRYGRKDLGAADRLKVRQHNWFASMVSLTAKLCWEHSLPFGIENPARRPGFISLFDLDELIQVATLPGVCFTKFPQCQFGSIFEKPTEILGTFDMSEFKRDCACSVRQWVVPWSGVTYTCSHPPLEGKQMPIPSWEWDPTMMRDREPEGPDLANLNAHYPVDMVRVLSRAIAKTFRAGIKRPAHELEDQSQRNSSSYFTGLPHILKRARISAQESLPRDLRDEEGPWVGGLRSPHKIVGRSSFGVNLGVQIRNLIDKHLDSEPRIATALLGSIGQPAGSTSLPIECIDSLRVEVAKLLARNCGLTLRDGCWEDFNQSVETEHCRTELKYSFMKLWSQALSDPASGAVDWLQEGAPAGLTQHPKLEGVWPEVLEEEGPIPLENLGTDFDTFENYEGVDSNPAAVSAIQGYIDKGYLKVFDTLDDCIAALGSEPILSKLGCITTEKESTEGILVTKHRIILDAKQSWVTAATARLFRSILPRITDAVGDILSLMSTLREGEILEQFVADISDASG